VRYILKMTFNNVIDHYYLELRNNCLAVAVGNFHSSFFIIGYIKYCPSPDSRIWRRGGTNYERLVKTYSPSAVRESTEWRVYIPFFDSDIPVIPAAMVSRVYDPLVRSLELQSRIKDPLEEKALEFIHEVQLNTNTTPGVTGSMLPGIHNVEASDLDFVVYGAKNSLGVVEFISENKDLFEEFGNSRLARWSRDVALNTGLTPREVVRFYRNWRRGVFKGREYSVVYNKGVWRDVLNLPYYRTLGRTRMIAEVEGGLEALNYPASSKITSYRIIEARELPVYDIEEVLSFEALFIPGLFEGGVFEVNGLLQCSPVLETCRVVLGVREAETNMKYYG